MGKSSSSQDIKDELTLFAVDAFVRSLSVNKSRPVSYLLGAGTSITSGMPSAERCIWEWKQDIFVTQNPNLRETVGEISLTGTKQRIQRWLDQRGTYPQENSSNEYAFYAEECYQTSRDRQSYFQSHVTKARPHTGYRLLPLLAEAGLISTIWTTNFDGLIARASAESNTVCIEVGVDSMQRVGRQHVQGELRVISMHGDFRYDELKNTEKELRSQEEALKDELLHELVDHDLVVIGYSGRDKSLMSILEQFYEKSGSSRIFWCGYGEDIPLPVRELLSIAKKNGHESFYIPSLGFDDIISRLALRQLDGDLLSKAKNILSTISQVQNEPSVFSVPDIKATSLVKSNAYPISCPRQALKLDISFPEGVNRRDWLNEIMPSSIGVSVTMGSGALSLGDFEVLNNTLRSNLRGKPITVALSDEDIAKDVRIQSLMKRAFTLSLAGSLGLETDKNRRVWERESYQIKSYLGSKYSIHNALSIRLITLKGKPYVVLMPEVVAKQSDGSLADRDASKVLRNEIYGYQHNNIFDSDLKRWVDRIVDIDFHSIGGGLFKISKLPIYAGLTQKDRKPLPDQLQKHVKQKGIIVEDANLIFSDISGNREIKNPNPLQGLVANRPWDFQLTSSGLSASINISTICPVVDATKFKNFLDSLNQRSHPAQSERDYLQDFPGFASAFGLPINYPNPRDQVWLNLDDNLSGSNIEAAKQLAQRICSCLDTVRSIQLGTVATIFVPARWAPYKIINTESEHFNLHDYVKAYAARHGQSTQFIREETAGSPQQCRVKWWLSLALYVKGLRTPWRIDCLDDETAFVGIGYGIEAQAAQGSRILLGCSHLYSARGEGLQFRLGRIENPIIRGRNPFMSEDDSRRTGQIIRQLFYDAKMKLPKRVVVHKRTRFTDEEQRGLSQGLDGVENVELIEINEEESLRYLSSKLSGQKLQIDRFPISRGSVIIQNSNTALLWVHGSSPSIQNPKFKYYQGKRRIPAPLVVRRYKGSSDIVQVATEILGLSKMNWNTFDYYSKMPTTLDSASKIARVGPYLSGFASAPYDYRLLI